MTDHLDFSYAEIQHEKFNMEFVKRVIPHVSKYDKLWKKFHIDKFDPKAFKAHKAMADTIKQEFDRLMEEYEKEKAIAEENAKK